MEREAKPEGLRLRVCGGRVCGHELRAVEGGGEGGDAGGRNAQAGWVGDNVPRRVAGNLPAIVLRDYLLCVGFVVKQGTVLVLRVS